jgi:hypothetical protein
MKDDSAAGTARVDEATKPDWMKLIRSYTMEDRRQATEPTRHRRRRGDEAERSSSESDE